MMGHMQADANPSPFLLKSKPDARIPTAGVDKLRDMEMKADTQQFHA